MAVPNVSAFSLKSRLSSVFLHPTTTHRSCCYGNAQSYRCYPSDLCKSNSCNLSWVSRTVPVRSRSSLSHLATSTGGHVIQHQTSRCSRSLSWRPCQVKNEDSEGTLSGEAIALDEQALERDLQIAIEEENYARAAKIRDSLRFLHEDSKASVLAANARFYNSFRKGDLAAMQALWAKGDNVCCVHPGVGGISGYDLIMGSWEFVWDEYEFPLEIVVKNVEAHVRGDVGYVTCMEVVKTKGSSWGKQFATNVFEKIDGQWYMCIHHASYIDV